VNLPFSRILQKTFSIDKKIPYSLNRTEPWDNLKIRKNAKRRTQSITLSVQKFLGKGSGKPFFKKREFDGEELFEKSSSPNPSSKTFRQIEEQNIGQLHQKVCTNFVILSSLKFFERGSGKTFFKKVFPESSIEFTLKKVCPALFQPRGYRSGRIVWRRRYNASAAVTLPSLL